jgi:hypothetical protein
MGRAAGDAKRGKNPGEGPRPGTAKADLLASWAKLSEWDRRATLRELAASFRASRQGRGREP